MAPKLTRRAAAKVAVAIVAAPSVAAHTIEPESDIRPVLPFSEEHARWLLSPIVPQPKVPHE